MLTYARQGGTSSIFICDDGMQLISPADRDARIAFYAAHDIGWVARPKHEDAPGGFKRAGRFKKASNMNYALALSLSLEKHLAQLQRERAERSPAQQSAPLTPRAGFGGSGGAKSAASAMSRSRRRARRARTQSRISAPTMSAATTAAPTMVPAAAPR